MSDIPGNPDPNKFKIDLDPNKPQQRQLRRLIIAEGDIRKARATALLIIERIRTAEDELFDPLSCATVIWYARPFIGSDDALRLPGKFSTFQARSYRELHTRLILQRNRFTAHMDEAFNEVFLIHKESPIMAGDSRLEVLSHSPFVETQYLLLAAFPEIVKLCNFQLDRLGVCIEKSKRRLFP